MSDETISAKCETLYNKLNNFVTKVINRDVPNKVYPIGSIYIVLIPQTHQNYSGVNGKEYKTLSC